MPTRPTTPDPSGTSPHASPFSGLSSGLGFFQDWLKAAGSALPHMPASATTSGVNSWAMPTLDPEEINKRIEDLKTVQFWLEQNTRMVAMTIQGLEVQKMTLSTLKGMNVSLDSLRDALTARHAAPDMSAFTGAAPATSNDEDVQTDEAPSSEDTHAGAASSSAELVNPMRWWDTLTEQFTHLASQASQTAQTVGSSMSDLLNTNHLATGAGTKAKASSPRKAAPAKKAARKSAAKKASTRSRKAAPGASAKG